MQAAEQHEGETGPDGYCYLPAGPRAIVHRLLDAYLEESTSATGTGSPPKELAAGRAILESEKRTQVELLRAALDRLDWLARGGKELLRRIPVTTVREGDNWRSTSHTDRGELIECAYRALFEALTSRVLPLTSEDLLHFLQVFVTNLELWEAARPQWEQVENPFLSVDSFEADEDVLEASLPTRPGFDLYALPTPGLIALILKHLEQAREKRGEEPPEVLRPWLQRLRVVLANHLFFAGYKRTVARLDELLTASTAGLPDPGKPWTDALIQDVREMEPALRDRWIAVLSHAPVVNQRKPAKKWLATAEKLLAELGEAEFAARVGHWFSLVGSAATEHFSDKNADLLKGLLWYCGLIRDAEMLRLLGSTAEECFKKLPQGGLLCSRGGLACLWALGHQPDLEALTQLNRLKLRVKSPWAQEEIGKALQSATEEVGVSLEEVDELTLPTYGLEGSGLLRSSFGSYTAEVRFIRAGHPEWTWQAADGKAPKGEPTAVKKAHGEALKAFKRSVDNAAKMLSAQRDRLERLLLTERSWSLAEWRERYLEHPLLAPLTRRLIWHFQDGDRKALAIPHAGQLTDVDGRPLAGLPHDSRVRLWHPIGFAPEEVLRWRVWLEEHGVTQPFKQAHREVYLLTDAELSTATYSNRFAAHIVKQHQLAALARQRGWSYSYLGSWDGGDAGAVLALPQWDLQAELWVDGTGGGLAASGVALYVATDQVRFVRLTPEAGAVPPSIGSHAPIALTDVPALVLTEVMRDVDLFVGVASVGNDPTWRDGGEGRGHEDYWESYSFGELSASAVTRREVLERLLPRLKIRERCSLEGKFLRVRGDLRNYKIHLGSGNILMEPNDQYLCIVPDRSPGSRDSLFLPFEGDATLSVIISKAFLLAEEGKIADPSILSQIKGR